MSITKFRLRKLLVKVLKMHSDALLQQETDFFAKRYSIEKELERTIEQIEKERDMFECVFGEEEMPVWLSDKVMAYKKTDGSTGYELDTGRRKIEIKVGDLITNEGRYLKVRKRKFKEDVHDNTDID